MRRPATATPVLARRLLALAAVVTALVTVSAPPANAAATLSLRTSSNSPTAGARITFSGAVSGSTAAVKVYRQVLRNGSWASQVSAPVSRGKYAMAFTASGPAVYRYRTLAVDSRGRAVAASPAVYVSWYTWQGAASLSAGTITVGGPMNDEVGSDVVAGHQYASSIIGTTTELGSDTTLNYSDDRIFSSDANRSVCSHLRYTVGLSDTNPAGALTGVLDVTSDTQVVTRRTVTPGQAVAVVASMVKSAGFGMTFTLTSGATSFQGHRVGLVMGTPMLRCRAKIGS